MKAGRSVGTLVEGERKFDVRVLFPMPESPEAMNTALLPLPFGASTQLGSIAAVTEEDSPALVSREGGRRRVLVEANVRGRDLGSFVQDVKARLDTIPLPPGYRIALAGQYEHLVHAAMRFAFLVPATLVAVQQLLRHRTYLHS
jgi:cobalt-zinc-cadmium resistance protein CzcA